jgi:hypothetical protein
VAVMVASAVGVGMAQEAPRWEFGVPGHRRPPSRMLNSPSAPPVLALLSDSRRNDLAPARSA